MAKTVVKTKSAPAPSGPYSQAIIAGGLVFASGQAALDAARGELVGGTIAEQTAQTLSNVRAVLEAAGSSLDQVVKATVYLSDLKDFAAMNEVYRQFFQDEPPARTTIQVAGLPLNALVEIEVIAAVGV